MSKPSNEFARFTKADQPAKERIIAASYGEVGTLKTTFWAQAPGPIVFLSFDKGLEGVIEPYQDEKDIYFHEYAWVVSPTETPDQEMAIDMRDEFIADFMQACKIARTVVIDKETELWDLIKYADFGAPREGTPKDWDIPKGRMRTLLNHPKSLDINFGVIQGMRNEWVSSVNPKNGKKGITQSGNRIRAGSDDVDAIMFINIEHIINENGTFSMKVGKSRGPGGRDVQNRTWPAMTFSEMGQLIFPDSTEESWK